MQLIFSSRLRGLRRKLEDMVTSGSAGITPQIEGGGGQLLQELEALSHALHMEARPASSPWNDSAATRERRSRSSHSISAATLDSVERQQQRQGYETQLQEVTNLSEWLQENGSHERRSLWNWKPLRALAHVGQQRFHCIFLAEVHAITNLPASLNGQRLTVQFCHKDIQAQTMPGRISHGCVEFDETLQIRCTVYGSKKVSQGIKYMPKTFILSVVSVGMDELELGNHQLDLSRMLPESFDDQGNGEKDMNRTTSFFLSGKARGGTLMVTFGYEILDKEFRNISDDLEAQKGRRSPDFNSVPNSPQTMPSASAHLSSPTVSEPGADLGNYPPIEHLSLDEEEARSYPSKSTRRLRSFSQSDISFKHYLWQSDSNAEKITPVGAVQLDMEVDSTPEDEVDFEVVDQGVEISPFSVNASVDPPTTAKDLEKEFETLQQLDLGIVPSIPTEILLQKDSRDTGSFPGLVDVENSRSFSATERKMGEGSNLDDEADLVTGEFLHMLEEGQEFNQYSSESEPNSPRALLWKQFEQEALLEGGVGLDLASFQASNLQLNDDDQPKLTTNARALQAIDEDQYATSKGGEDESELAAILSAAETELQKATQKMRSKARAKILEDAETEALMHEWGLNEKAFQSSAPPKSKHGLDFASSSTRMPPPPPLAQGFDAVIPTRDGGSLRSMSSAYFQRGQFDGRLVMHVSKPVVVPAEMGYSAVDILQGLAAAGMDQMAAQAMHTMPLDDITGKSVHQIAFEGRANFLESSSHRYLALGSAQRGDLHLQTTRVHNVSADHASTDIYSSYTQDISGGFERKSRVNSRSSTNPFEQYMSLEELAPVAMGKIEALAMEGLKIQCDMAEEVAPYNIEACSWKDMATSKGDKVNKGYGNGLTEGIAPMHLLEGTKSGEEDSQMGGGLMSMAISLEEWMRLDAGVYDESENNNKTLAILAAHHATHNEIVPRGKRDNEHEKTKVKVDHGRSQKGGIMNDTLTLAMLVQLRDPLRNYEPVGSPMMAFIQAERVIVPPHPKMWKRVYVKGNGEDEEDAKRQEEQIPQFKITGVHMAGLNTRMENKNNTKKIWGNERQHQTGARWLIANGMSKATTSKHPILRSKQMPAKTKVKQGESLWSISARVHGSGAKWPEIAALNPHIRNPNIIFENDTIRMR